LWPLAGWRMVLGPMRIRLRLRSQLLIGVGIYLALVIGVGLTGLYLAVTSLVGMQESVEHYVHEVSVVGQIAAEINSMQSSVLAHVLSDSVEEEVQHEQEIATIEARVDALLDDLIATQRRFNDVQDLRSIGAFRGAWDEFVRVQDSQFLLLSREDREQEEHQFVQANGPLGESFAAVRRELQMLQSSLPSESAQELREAEDGFSRTRTLLIGAILFAGAVGAGLGLTQAARLAHAIEELTRGARRVAGGNLTAPVCVRTGDELEVLADSFNAMTDSLRAVDRMKNEFVSMVSHELRTPMHAVIGMTDLLLRQGLGPREREYVQALHRSGESLLAVINDILDLSRIEAGRFELEQAPLDVRGVVEDVTLLLTQSAQRKGVQVRCQVDSTIPAKLTGDGHRLRQVLMNLVGNAVKFTDTGEVVVQVSSDGRMTRFDVKDTGIGISEESQAKLFQPFAQASRRYGGTGLGLAISKSLVELMGGQIGVESRPGLGSTFWFTLPLARAEGSAPDEPTARVAAQAAQTSGRVLVADDNALSRQVAAAMLGHLGYAVDVASNGREAVERVEAGSEYTAILMDCQMPELDGFEAAAAIRRREGGQRVPIIALTAAAMSTDRERCLASDMDDYLAKPVRMEMLESVLRRHQALMPEPIAEAAMAFSSTPEGPIDLDALALLRAQVAPYAAGGEDVLRQMFDLFEEAVAPQLDALRAAAVAGDTTALRRAAHSVRGSGATIGAREVRQLAQELEALGQGESLEHVLPLVQQLEAAVQRASAALAAAAV
jgi:signal transduction histidine kinase/CheY-like chemotaxis protein